MRPVKVEGFVIENGFTVQNCANFFQISCQTVRNYIKQGKIKAKKENGTWIIPNLEIK